MSEPEEEPVTPKKDKRGRALPQPWTCLKCGRTFKRAGRHAKCTGGPKVKKTKAPPGSSLNGYEARVATFNDACQDMMKLLQLLHTEVVVYRQERDEYAKKWQQIESMITKQPAVPR